MLHGLILGLFLVVSFWFLALALREIFDRENRRK
jgi:hypothetical protein